MHRKVIAAVVLSLFSVGATASDWQIAAVGGGIISEIDVASLRRSGDIVYAWERRVYEAEQHTIDGKVYLSVRIFEMLNCAERTMATTDFTSFATATFDTVVDSGSIPDAQAKWSRVPPDSLSEAILNFACEMAPKAAK